MLGKAYVLRMCLGTESRFTKSLPTHHYHEHPGPGLQASAIRGPCGPLPGTQVLELDNRVELRDRPQHKARRISHGRGERSFSPGQEASVLWKVSLICPLLVMAVVSVCCAKDSIGACTCLRGS